MGNVCTWNLREGALDSNARVSLSDVSEESGGAPFVQWRERYTMKESFRTFSATLPSSS